MLRFSALLLFIVFAGVANASKRFYVPETEPPYGASAQEVKEALDNGCSGPQTELNLCAWSYYRDSQLRIEAISARFIASLGSNKSELERFQNSQKKWIHERNRKCDQAAQANEGGSMVWSVIYYCRKSENDSRSEEIEDRLRCVKKIDCRAQP